MTHPNWLRIYGNDISLLGIFNKGNELIGTFSIFFGSKLGQKYIITPPYSTDIGLQIYLQELTVFQRNKIVKNVMESIAEYLSNQKVLFVDLVLPYEFKDVQPFLWKNYDCSVRYTYLLDLQHSEAEMIAQMSPERRKNIKDAIKSITYQECIDYNFAFKKIVSSLDENNASYSTEIVKNILLKFTQYPNHICIETQQENQLSSIHFIATDHANAYYLFGWNNKNISSFAGTYGLWQCILEAKKRGITTFNFAGSAIPSIEKYFRGFGGELVPYFNIKRQNLLGQILLKMKK